MAEVDIPEEGSRQGAAGINRSKSAKNAKKNHGFFEGRFRKYAVFSVGSTCMVKKPMDKSIEVCKKCKKTMGFLKAGFESMLFFQSDRHAWSKNPWINRSKSAKNAKNQWVF